MGFLGSLNAAAAAANWWAALQPAAQWPALNAAIAGACGFAAIYNLIVIAKSE